MIDTIRLKKSVDQLAKAGTSGYQTVEEWNNNLRLVQISILTLFREMYEREQIISDAISPFVTNAPVSNVKPNNYFSFVEAEINGEVVYPISRNRVAMTKTSPIRKPSASKQVYYYYEGDQVKFLVDGSMTGTMTYIRRPDDSILSVSYIDSDDSDYETYAVDKNLEWPELVENLFVYLMLERLGISQKDNLLIEYSKLGLQFEAAKLQ